MMGFRRKTRTPRLIQMEAVECGPVALGIILGYYGRYLTLETLRRECGVSREGTNIDTLVQVAQYFGLEAEVFSAEVEDLKDCVLPAIVYWKFNHFIVLEEFRGNIVYVNDPESGPQSMHIEDFARGYSGIVIEMKPGPSFVKEGAPTNIWKKIREKIQPFKDSFAYLFFTELGLGILGLTIPVFAQIFIDQFFRDSLPNWSMNYLWMMGGVILLMAIVSWSRGLYVNFLQARISMTLSANFLSHILRLPTQFFTQRYGGEVINRIGLNTYLGETITQDVILNLLNMVILSGYAVIMFMYNVWIPSAALLLAFCNLAILWYVNKKRANDYALLQQTEAKTIGVSFDILENIEGIKSIGNDSQFFTRVAGTYTKNINAQQKIGIKDIILSTISHGTEELGTILVLAIGTIEIINGHITIGQLIALQILLNNFLAPFLELVDFSTEIQSLEVDFARLDDVLKNPEDPILINRKENEKVERFKGNLEFQHVSFGYAPHEEPFIRDFNLKIQEGEIVGLVGGIGSGKSTIAKLGVCLYTPWTGKILYDGKEFSEYSRKTMSHSIGHVDQTIFLFSGTVRENIALWDASISDEEIHLAARMACIDSDIQQLPEGILSKLMEQGRNFSEGQRQRLELARALVLHPTIIFLDEATSFVDIDNELEILSNLRKLGISCLIISHRLKTLQFCNKIAVIKHGKIIQEGTHDQLSQTPGYYKHLYEHELKIS